VNAWWLAEAALLAYAEENDIRNALGQTGGNFTVQCFSEGSTQCFVAHNQELIFLAFRGTEVKNFWRATMDWIVGLDFIPVQDGHGGKVHHGFKVGLEQVWENVKAYMTKVQQDGQVQPTLWLTGHSLGAALATLAAYYITWDHQFLIPVQGLYTFGSPRVGDSAFQQGFSTKGLASKTYRVMNHQDIVPRVPPTFLYADVGLLKYIDTAGHLRAQADESQIGGDVDIVQLAHSRFPRCLLQLALGNQDAEVPGPLADHAPIYYAIHMWNNLEPV
jgi:triacylglycerol lipase